MSVIESLTACFLPFLVCRGELLITSFLMVEGLDDLGSRDVLFDNGVDIAKCLLGLDEVLSGDLCIDGPEDKPDNNEYKDDQGQPDIQNKQGYDGSNPVGSR